MEFTPVVAFLAAFVLMVPAQMYLRRYLLLRGARTVIGRLQEHNAVAEAVARTPETLGLRVKKPFGRKSYQVMALDFLVQEDVVRFTPDGLRLYLTDRVRDLDPSLLPK